MRRRKFRTWPRRCKRWAWQWSLLGDDAVCVECGAVMLTRADVHRSGFIGLPGLRNLVAARMYQHYDRHPLGAEQEVRRVRAEASVLAELVPETAVRACERIRHWTHEELGEGVRRVLPLPYEHK